MHERADRHGGVNGGEGEPGDHRAAGCEHAGRAGDDRRERNRENGPRWKAELRHGVALDQISHDGGMHEHAGDVAAGLLRGAGRGGQGATRCGRAVISAGKAHRGELAVLEIEDGAEQHDLAVEGAAEEIAVAFLDAGAQVGEGIGRDVAAHAAEVERQRVGDRARDRVAGQLRRAGWSVPGRRVERARGEFDRHRRDRLAVDGKAQRHPPDHVIGVGMHVEGADIVFHRQSLRAVGYVRMVIAENLAEHQLAAVGELPQCDEIVPVKALQAAAERRIAERNLRLLDRAWKDDVEADDLGAAFGDASEHPADLARPGLGRRSLERRSVVGLPVDRNHDDRRGRGIAVVADQLAAHRGEDVERRDLAASEAAGT